MSVELYLNLWEELSKFIPAKNVDRAGESYVSVLFASEDVDTDELADLAEVCPDLENHINKILGEDADDDDETYER